MKIVAVLAILIFIGCATAPKPEAKRALAHADDKSWQLIAPSGEDEFKLPIRVRPAFLKGQTELCDDPILAIKNDHGLTINFAPTARCTRTTCPGQKTFEIEILTTDASGHPFEATALREAANYLAKNQHYYSGRAETTNVLELESHFFSLLKSQPQISLMEFLNPIIKEQLRIGHPPMATLNCFSASHFMNIPYLSKYPQLATSKALLGSSDRYSPLDLTAEAYRPARNMKPQFGSVYADSAGSHSYTYLMNGFCVEKRDEATCDYYHISLCTPSNFSEDHFILKSPQETNLATPLRTLDEPNTLTRERVVEIFNSGSYKSGENKEVDQTLRIFFGSHLPAKGLASLKTIFTGMESAVETSPCFFDKAVAKIMNIPTCEAAFKSMLTKCMAEHWVEVTRRSSDGIVEKKICP